MQLSQQAIRDFKKTYLKVKGKKLSNREANEKGLKLLNFFKLVYKPIPIKDKDLFIKGKNE